jgi:hypothetical protein
MKAAAKSGKAWRRGMFGRKRRVGGERAFTDVAPIGCLRCGIAGAESAFGKWRQNEQEFLCLASPRTAEL